MTEGDRSAEGRRNGPDRKELVNAAPPPAGGREVRIGIFVIAGAFAVLLALFLLTDPGTFRGRYTVMTQVDDAGGVRAGDPVQMRGVNIGRVRRFTLANDGVIMTLEINGEWEIPTDSRSRVAGMGLLGGRTIEILPGDSPENLTGGEVIPGESTGGLTDLTETFSGDVEDILQRLQRLLDDPTLEAVQGSTVGADRLLGELSEVVQEQRDELEALTSSLRRSAEELEEPLSGPELTRTLARADSAAARLNVVGGRLETASASLEEVLGRIERGEGTLGLFSRDEELYRNLNRVAESLLSLSEDIRENPGRYVRLRIF